MKLLFYLLAFIFITNTITAQQLTGKVISQKEAIP